MWLTAANRNHANLNYKYGGLFYLKYFWFTTLSIYNCLLGSRYNASQKASACHKAQHSSVGDKITGFHTKLSSEEYNERNY